MSVLVGAVVNGVALGHVDSSTTSWVGFDSWRGTCGQYVPAFMYALEVSMFAYPLLGETWGSRSYQGIFVSQSIVFQVFPPMGV